MPETAGATSEPKSAITQSSSVGQGLSTSEPSTSQRLATAMGQIHMTVCAAAVQRVADFLMEGQAANFVLQPLGSDPNRWPVVVVIESTHPAAGHTRLSTIMAAPTYPCSGMYEQTIYWSKPCAELRRTTFDQFSASHALLKDVQASETNAGLQLYLMAGGAGCVSVKKELFR